MVDVDTSNNGCCFMSCLLERKIFTSQWGKRKLNSPSNVDTAQRSYSAVSTSQPGFNSLVGTMFWAFNLLLNSSIYFTSNSQLIK